MKKLILAAIILSVYAKVNAQTVTTAPVVKDTTVIKKSPVKTLTYVQYNALLKGEDLYGMALPAELNHYPSPDNVIKYKHQLDLSPIQVNKITAIAKEMHRKKLEMGLIIIDNEKMIDSLFKKNVLEDGSLIFYTNRYGLYQGELRNAILQAYLATRKLLSQQQVNKIEALEKAK
jgi:hypothetical protein